MKRYYKISEICSDMNVSASKIRHYEKELGITVTRKGRNYGYHKGRTYLQSEYNDMIFIIALMQTKRFRIYGAGEYVKELRNALEAN